MAEISKDRAATDAAKPDGDGGQTGHRDGALKSLVEVEKLVQLGLLIPCATVVGWIAGVGLDRWLHQHWIFIPGLLLGATAGFVQLFRVVLQNTKE